LLKPRKNSACAKSKKRYNSRQEEKTRRNKSRVYTEPSTDDVSSTYSAADLERLQQQSFAQRKGKMLWPTQGKLLHQFGDNRQGSVTWDGLRIQAESGTPVRAIHGGRVMYADTLRGQGLLIVLDHGDGYMSLYAHNDALLREAGEWVQPSDVIARAGNSGGEKESALYFEIRKNGNPIDPLPWLNK
jgi:septal ring factor EnvC (AmiA/AmiB activator)